MILESKISSFEDFSQALLGLLENLREVKSRPQEINQWSDGWFEAEALFVYETFIYIIAALIKTNSFMVLREIFTSNYLLPEPDRYSDVKFENFGGFYAYSNILQSVLAPDGQRLLSPAAELIKIQSDRVDIPFKSLMEADLLSFLMSILNPQVRWFPQTLYYAWRNGDFLFFTRASQHKHFKNLAVITGISDADELRKAVVAHVKETRSELGHRININSLLDIEKWDTMK